MKKRLLRLLVLTVCTACALSAVCAGAYAIDPIEPDRNVSLTVALIKGNTAIPDAPFSIYRVADTDEWAHFTAVGAFSDYTGEINGFKTADEWDTAAALLKSYAAKKSIVALDKGKTDKDGLVTFSKDMKPGLYLVICGEVTYKSYIYTAKPFLVCLPNRVEGSDELLYDATVVAKPGVRPVPSPTPTPPPYLPQTGQLWWPVPALVCGGLFLILIGVVKRRSNKDEA